MVVTDAKPWSSIRAELQDTVRIFTSSLFRLLNFKKNFKLRGFGPLANYADRATADSWRGSTNFCG
jgi:hypothetical protein